MIKAFIFDMDGVIMDSEPLHYESDRMIMRGFGIELSDEELNPYVGVGDLIMWTELKERYNLGLSIEELIKKQNANKLRLLKAWDIETIEGIDSLLVNLKEKRIKIALASSSTRKFIGLALDKMGITQCFDVIVSGEEVVNGKPAPDIFLRAAELLKVEPRNCIVLEDSRNGVNAAKDAGMKCIGYINPNSGNQDLSRNDKIVSTLKDLEYESLYESE